MRQTLIALPGAAGLGVAAGFAGFALAVATGSELVVTAVVVALPPLAVHFLYPSLPRVHRAALGAIAVATAAAILYLGLSGYSS